MLRALSPLLAVSLGLIPTAELLAQEKLSSTEAKRYAKELDPEHPVEQRLETIENVAFYHQERSTKVLIEGLKDSLLHLEELEEQRAETDEKLRQLIEPQILASKGEDPLINYAGAEVFQEKLKELGAAITAEERLVRAYTEKFEQISDPKSLTALRKVKDKKPPRLVLCILSAFGQIDNGLITEHLIEKLSDKDIHVRIAAAEALGHHPRDRVPVTAYAAMLQAPEWQPRLMAIDALARIGGSEALGLLIMQVPNETGRELTELVTRLELMTGQKFGKSKGAWLNWWKDQGQTFKGAGAVLQRPVLPKGDGRVEYWGVRIDSLRVIFIIDISGTMQAALDDHENLYPEPGKSRLDLARREIKSAIGGMPSDAYFNLIAYNDIVMSWEEHLQAATPDTKKEAYEWLDKLVAVSATNIFDALEMGFQMARPGNKDRRYARKGDTVLFLSDGGPTAGRTTDEDEILAQVREWNRTANITIHTIGIGRQLNRKFMKALAEQNGGQVQFIE